ncbi:MAG: hypothetical protein U0M13_10605 [Desulfovibrio fairfieldensis]|nr:hypothetical protein [Desulfovibrio fairfieldensis]
MSFLGSIAGPLRKVIAAYADELTVPVLLPCAGNFTVGAALRSGGYQGRISGCDITLYTSALGAYLAGNTLSVAEREDCPEHLRGLLDFSDPAHLAASVSIMLDLRQVWKNQNVWHRRMLANYRRNWPQLMEKALAKLEAYRAHLNRGDGFAYVPQDAAAFLSEHDQDHAVFIAPPTFGSRSDINQERVLAASAQWSTPEYTEISFKGVPIYQQITSFREWMIIMERPLPEVEKLLGEPVAVVHKGRKSITYAYAGHSKRRVVTRGYLNSRSPGPIFPGDKFLTGEETPGIILMDKKQTVRMNELFMSARVDYFLADVALSLALCLDKKIIGKLDFNLTKYAWALPEPGHQIYQRSDLAVPSVEPRLAKLVLMLCQSHEVKQLIDATFKDDVRYAVTTAFSHHPVSMKYRGVYKLHKRLEDPDSGGYRLNYYGELGLWNLADGYAAWLKKFHK